MTVRGYEEDDLVAVQRIWQECGWIDEDESEILEPFLADADVVVAELDGEAEACVAIHDGELRHMAEDLPVAVVTSVTTGRLGRRQGLARAALDMAVRRAADRGAAVAVLGMFEQGFYDRSGFGTGSEMLMLRVDPAHLRTPPARPGAVRLTLDDTDDITACLLARRLPHGAVSLPSASLRFAERSWDDDGFGLGYRDATGALTHFVWCSVKDEYGPYEVRDWAWRDTEQLHDLLALLAGLGDQVRTIVIPEPADAQLQVLVDHPNRLKETRTTGEHRVELRASAWWQARILDLPRCIEVLHADRDLVCNLHVDDPLGLDGVAGDWVLRLGATSSVERGHEEDLPWLQTSVGALTRLWLGVRPPSTLAATDPIEASPDLLRALDEAIRLPRPDVQMDF